LEQHDAPLPAPAILITESGVAIPQNSTAIPATDTILERFVLFAAMTSLLRRTEQSHKALIKLGDADCSPRHSGENLGFPC